MSALFRPDRWSKADPYGDDPIRPFSGGFDPSRMTGPPPAPTWIIDGVVMSGLTCLLTGHPGVGKCVAAGTPILMFEGTTKNVEDIREGELLMGPDSQPRTVRGVTRGIGPLFRVTPSKGDSYIVNENHVLSLRFSPKSTQKAFPFPVNISVQQYLSLSLYQRHHLKGWRTSVEWPHRDVEISPYLLGLWLGDGTAGFPEITSADPEMVVDALAEFAAGHPLRVRQRAAKGHGAAAPYRLTKRGGKTNAFSDALRALGIFHDKQIPFDYLANDSIARLQLLAGLIDTDGHLAHGCYEITQKNERLAQQILFLARSLGFAAYSRVAMKQSQNSPFLPYHRIFISGDIARIPVRLERKRASERQQKKDVLVTGIKIEPIGNGEFFGFEVSGDHLFLLGDFTVTHNSLLLQQALTAVALGKPWLGFATESQNCFGYLCEDPDIELQRRQWELFAHYDVLPPDLENRFRWESGTRADNAMWTVEYGRGRATRWGARFWDEMEKGNFGFVVIDTAAAVFRGNPNNSSQVTEFVEWCNREAGKRNITLLISAHQPKNDSSPFSGSTAWLASVRSAVTIGRPKDSDGINDARRQIYGFKANYSAGLRKYDFHFQDGAFVLDNEAEAPSTHRATAYDHAALDARLLDGLIRTRNNGDDVPADVMKPYSLPDRARRSPDRSLRLIPLNTLYASQERLIASGKIVRVLVKNRVMIRPASGRPYPGERAWDLP